MPLTALRTQIKWILAIFIVIFTVSIGFMYGVGGSGSKKNPDGSTVHEGDYSVAKIDGKELRRSQLQLLMRDYVERNNVKLNSIDIRLVYKQVLDDLVANTAVDNEVQNLKITPSETDVNAQLKQVQSQYVTKEAFLQNLQQRGVTLDTVKSEIQHELAVRKLFENIAAGVKISDDEVKSTYDVLKVIPGAGLMTPAGITGDFAVLRNESAAKKLSAALTSGTSWDIAVKTVSSADLVTATPEKAPQRVPAEALKEGTFAFLSAMKNGEFSAPIKVGSEDFIVAHRIAAVSEDVVPYKDAEPRLREMILQQHRIAEQQKYVKNLTNKMKVEILDPELFPKSEDVVVKSSDTAPKSETPAATSKTGVSKPEAPKASVPTSAPKAVAPKTESSATVPQTATSQPAPVSGSVPPSTPAQVPQSANTAKK